jgi:hypothetical protein
LPLLRSLTLLRSSLTLRGLVLLLHLALLLLLLHLVLLCLVLLLLLLRLVLLHLVLLCLVLLLLLLRLVLLCLVLLLLLLRLVLLSLVLLCLVLLLYSPIGLLQSRWGPHVAICRKRPGRCHVGRASVVDRRKLSPVRSGCLRVLHLCPHRRSMLLMQSCQFHRPCSHLHSAPSAIEAHTVATPVIADRAVVDVMHR